MKRLGVHGVCIGCGVKKADSECECDWVECHCGYKDCWVDEDGNYHCESCDYCSDKYEEI